jgi:hypothetical protein
MRVRGQQHGRGVAQVLGGRRHRHPTRQQRRSERLPAVVDPRLGQPRPATHRPPDVPETCLGHGPAGRAMQDETVVANRAARRGGPAPGPPCQPTAPCGRTASTWGPAPHRAVRGARLGPPASPASPTRRQATVPRPRRQPPRLRRQPPTHPGDPRPMSHQRQRGARPRAVGPAVLRPLCAAPGRA